MKRLAAIILIVVVVLILGATPAAARPIGPEENGNFCGSGNHEPSHPWQYIAGTWYGPGGAIHGLSWSTAVFIIPTVEAGHASFKSPTHGNIGIYGTPFYLPVP